MQTKPWSMWKTHNSYCAGNWCNIDECQKVEWKVCHSTSTQKERGMERMYKLRILCSSQLAPWTYHACQSWGYMGRCTIMYTCMLIMHVSACMYTCTCTCIMYTCIMYHVHYQHACMYVCTCIMHMIHVHVYMYADDAHACTSHAGITWHVHVTCMYMHADNAHA